MVLHLGQTRSPGQELVNGSRHMRSLAILEKALGPEHPNVATSLLNYAALLRETGRTEDAEKLETHAQAIRAKHA